MEKPPPPAEGALIEQAREQVRPSLSIRQAAQRANMSEGRWRQIVNGYQSVSAGHVAPVTGPAETIARMAYAVGLKPTDLTDAGRADAADELERMQQPAPGIQEFSSAELAAEVARRLSRLEELDGAAARPVTDLQERREALDLSAGKIAASPARRPKRQMRDESGDIP